MFRSRVRHLLSTPLAALTLVALLVGCGGSSGPAAVSTTTKPGPTTTVAPTVPPSAGAPCGRPGTAPGRYQHVVVIMEENRTWTGGRSNPVGMGFSNGKMPFLQGLATRCSSYTDWSETNGGQNSLNQYVGLTSGVVNTATVNDCTPSDSCHSTDDNLFRQIREAGGTPRSFVDGATQPCSPGSNRSKHIPALYYWGADDRSFCTKEVRPFTELDPAHLPTLAFVSPDMCHDGHDCGDDQVDAWAKSLLTRILDGATYRAGRTLVVVVYDEDRPVPNLLIAPTAHPGPISRVAGSHAALLKTIEQLLGLPVLHQGQLPAAISLRSSANI